MVGMADRHPGYINDRYLPYIPGCSLPARCHPWLAGRRIVTVACAAFLAVSHTMAEKDELWAASPGGFSCLPGDYPVLSHPLHLAEKHQLAGTASLGRIRQGCHCHERHFYHLRNLHRCLQDLRGSTDRAGLILAGWFGCELCAFYWER